MAFKVCDGEKSLIFRKEAKKMQGRFKTNFMFDLIWGYGGHWSHISCHLSEVNLIFTGIFLPLLVPPIPTAHTPSPFEPKNKLATSPFVC